jgi:ribulose-phosphate 3-epimerase
MILRPDWYVERCVEMGAHTVMIHIEAPCDTAETIEKIRRAGGHPGLTVNPDTPVESVADYLATVDEVLCMSVYPGFGGQSFMPVALAKLRWLRQQRPDLDISIDGGINLETAVRSAEAGANIFDVGTTLFRATDMAEDIAAMRAQTRDAFGKRVNENAPEVASR